MNIEQNNFTTCDICYTERNNDMFVTPCDCDNVKICKCEISICRRCSDSMELKCPCCRTKCFSFVYLDKVAEEQAKIDINFNCDISPLPDIYNRNPHYWPVLNQHEMEVIYRHAMEERQRNAMEEYQRNVEISRQTEIERKRRMPLSSSILLIGLFWGCFIIIFK